MLEGLIGMGISLRRHLFFAAICFGVGLLAGGIALSMAASITVSVIVACLATSITVGFRDRFFRR